MKMEIDLTNEIVDFEEIGMLNPFDFKNSLDRCREAIKFFNFSTEVYPDNVVKECLDAI